MPGISGLNMYFDGTRGWFGPGGPVSFDASRLIRVDQRSLTTALISRFGKGALTRVVFIDWSGGVYKGPYAGRRFGGYFIPMAEALMWTDRHLAALRYGKHADYNQIHSHDYPTVTLEVPWDADDQWRWGTAYDPVHDPAGARLWLQRD